MTLDEHKRAVETARLALNAALAAAEDEGFSVSPQPKAGVWVIPPTPPRTAEQEAMDCKHHLDRLRICECVPGRVIVAKEGRFKGIPDGSVGVIRGYGQWRARVTFDDQPGFWYAGEQCFDLVTKNGGQVNPYQARDSAKVVAMLLPLRELTP